MSSSTLYNSYRRSLLFQTMLFKFHCIVNVKKKSTFTQYFFFHKSQELRCTEHIINFKQKQILNKILWMKLPNITGYSTYIELFLLAVFHSHFMASTVRTLSQAGEELWTAKSRQPLAFWRSLSYRNTHRCASQIWDLAFGWLQINKCNKSLKLCFTLNKTPKDAYICICHTRYR